MATKKSSTPDWQRYLNSLSSNDLQEYSYRIDAQRTPAPVAPVLPIRAEVQPAVAVEQTSPQPTAETDEPSGFWSSRVAGLQQDIGEIGGVIDALQAGGYKDAANILSRAARSNNTSARAAASTAGFFEGLSTGDFSKAISGFANPQESVARLRQQSDLNAKAATNVLQPVVDRGGLEGFAAQTLQDAASSGVSSAASLVGGPVGAIAAGVPTYAQAYEEAKQAGLPDEQAESYAIVQGGIEGGISAVPAERALEKIPYVGKWLSGEVKGGAKLLAEKLTDPAISSAIRTAKTMAGEGAEEAATEAVQSVAAAAAAGLAESDQQKAFLNKQADLENLPERARRAAAAGALMGAATAPIEIRSANREFRQAENEQANTTTNALLANRQVADVQQAVEEVQPTVDQEMFSTPDNLPAQEEYQAERQRELEEDAAYRLRNRERAADTNQEDRRAELRQSIVNRVDTARQRVETLQDQVEAEQSDNSFRGATSSQRNAELLSAIREQQTAERDLSNFDATMLNTPDAVVEETAPQAQEQAEPEQADLFAQQQDQAAQRVAKRRQSLLEKQQKENATKTKQQRAAETKRRNELTDQLIQQNPQASDAEIAALVDQRMAQAPVTQTASPTVQVAPAQQASTQQATTPAPVDVRELFRQQSGQSVPNADQSLAMEATAAPTQPTQDFAPRAERLVKDLVRRNTDQTVGVQNLIRQGKLVVTDTPESVGRTNQTAQAEFDPQQGRMYVYLNRMNEDNAVPAILASVHEATHAGQFNDREGRPSILQQMMSRDRENVASNTIRRAANGGNAIARRAVELAQQSNPNSNVQDLELVPYFVSEAAAARTTTLGSLRGVAADIVSAGKNFLRDKLGVDMNVTLQDIDSAAKQIPNEIVQTDLTPRQNASVEMIAGRSATGYRQAVNSGNTYLGRVDEQERFEIPDTTAELNNEGLNQLRDEQVTTLQQLLDHPDLYANYPQFANMEVNEDASLAGTATYGYYDRAANTITLNPTLRANAMGHRFLDKERFRNLLLHEIQHAVQNLEGFVPGASAGSFIPRSVINRLNSAKYAMSNVINKFDIGAALQKLSPDNRRIFENEVKAFNLESRRAQAQLFLEEGYLEDVTDRLLRRYQDTFNAAKRDLDSANSAYYNAERAAFETYQRDYGETEARNTEYRSRMTPEELAAAWPESTMQNAEGRIPVERTLDTTPYIGGTRSVPQSARLNELRAKGVENMNQEEQVEYANLLSNTSDPVRSMSLEMAITPTSIDNIKQLKPKEQTFRILRHQTNSRTADVNSAEDVFNQMERAINKYIKINNADRVNVNKDINTQLSNMDNMSDTQQQQAWEAFSNKYPEIAPIIKDVRDKIDKNTLDIVKARLDDPRPTTPIEDKEILNLLNNRGKYMHRAYAAFQGQTGKKFADARVNGFDKATALLAKGKSITAKLQEHYDATLGAINFLTDRIQIPERADLEEASVDSLERMYETWVGPLNSIPYDPSSANSSAERKALMVQSLDNVRADITPAMVRNEARKIADSIIGIRNDTNGFAQSFSALARDTGVLRYRENVPPQIRRFLGEYTDPSARVLTTLAGQAGFLARARALAEIKREGNGSLVVDKATARERGNERFSVALNGEQYGALNGWYAIPEVADKISTITSMTQSWEQAWNEFGSDPSILANKAIGATVKGLRKASGTQKLATVVANPYKWARNFIGSPLMSIREGNINPFTYATGFAGASDYIRNTWSGRVSDRLDSYVRYLGIESARVAEVQHILGSTLEDVIKGKPNAGNTALAKLKRGGRTLIAGYSMADAWTKIANFENRANILRNYYEAAGIAKTEDQIMQEAGDDTNYTNISYDRAANSVRGLEKSGVSQYAPYFYEVFRTTGTNFIQAAADIKRATNPNLPPKAAAIMMYAGMSRMIGNSLVTFGAPFALSLAGATLSGGDDDNWRRNLISEFNKNQDLIYFGNNSDKMPVFLPVGTIDPIGPITDLMRTWTFTSGSETEKAKALFKQVTGMYIAPSWISRMYDAATRTTQPEPRLARMLPDYYNQFVRSLESIGVDGNITNRAVFATESWLPDWLKSFDPRTQPDIEGGFSADALNAMGAQFEVLNPQRRLIEANVKQRDKRSQALNNVNVLLSNSPNLTGNELKSALVGFKDTEMSRLKDIYNLRVSLEKWGQDEKSIKGMLKDAGFAQSDIQAIYSPNPHARLSMQSIKQYVDKRNLGVSKQESDRRAKIADENIRKLKASRDFLASLGVTLEN